VGGRRDLAGARGRWAVSLTLLFLGVGRPLHLGAGALGRLLGAKRDRVEAGSDFGVQDSYEMLLEKIQGAVDAGFKRTKLKVRPGWDLEMLKLVRETFPRHTFHIDCNSGYWLDDLPFFKEVDRLGLAIHDAYGGAGADNVSYALAMEEVSRACASTGVIMSVNNSLVCDPIYKFGNEDQKKRFLAPLASGKQLGCFGLTQPASGSDAPNLATDCADPGCNLLPCGAACLCTGGIKVEQLCSDGLDNDGDGKADCADTDCDVKACASGCTCLDGGARETNCQDAIDNDNDAGADCNDPACAQQFCAPGTTQRCYGGDERQAGVGVCNFGMQTCIAGTEFANWGPCPGWGNPPPQQCLGMAPPCNPPRG